jgi:hypothetical protein
MKSSRKRYGSEPNKGAEEDAGKKDEFFDLKEVLWNCLHCLCSREDAGLIKVGPNGEESLCESCGSYYEIHEELPDHRLNLYKYAV